MKNLLYLIALVFSLMACESKSGHLADEARIRQEVYREIAEKHAVERNVASRHAFIEFVATADTAKWSRFLDCSANVGDQGCDSCFYLVYGFDYPY